MSVDDRSWGAFTHAIDQAFGLLPAAHLRPPHGLCELRRQRRLARGGRGYPTVMATFTAETGRARFFDAAFAGARFMPSADGSVGTAAVHAVVGCALSRDRDVYGRFARLVGRSDIEWPDVVVLDKSVLAAALSGLEVDFAALPPAVDFAIAYALFANQPERLRKHHPSVFQLLHTRVFTPRGAGAAGSTAAEPELMVRLRG